MPQTAAPTLAELDAMPLETAQALPFAQRDRLAGSDNRRRPPRRHWRRIPSHRPVYRLF